MSVQLAERRPFVESPSELSLGTEITMRVIPSLIKSYAVVVYIQGVREPIKRILSECSI